MGLNVTDACEWLQTSPVIDEVTNTITKLKLRFESYAKTEQSERHTLNHVIQILESAEADLLSGDNIHSYKKLLEKFKEQGFDYAATPETQSSELPEEEYKFDPSPLIDHTSLEPGIVLSNKEKQDKIKELRAMLAKNSSTSLTG